LAAATRSRAFRAIQIVFVVAVVWYASASIGRQWNEVRVGLSELRPKWTFVTASGICFLVAYGVLIQTWRVMLRGWRAELPALEAARIWFISNLGRYLPGKVWQIGALAVMSRERGVSPVAATGASLVVNLTNILSGFVVVLLTGAPLIALSSTNGVTYALLITGVLAAGLVLLPIILPRLATLAGRLTNRQIDFPPIPARAIWVAAIGTAVAWVLYGIAFQLLVMGTLRSTAGDSTAYIAVFTSSYLVGYLALIAPGGIGVRETMLVAGMSALGLATEPHAWLVALVSRLWLTVLEVLPGVLFIARDGIRRRLAHQPENGRTE
jgi:glycosyltransferase 2 family protein